MAKEIPQNRGKSNYVRISWDEALDIIVGEIKRIIDKYGPYAIFAQADGHGETKMVHVPHGSRKSFLRCWADTRCRHGIRIAGRAGTGAPSMSGDANR